VSEVRVNRSRAKGCHAARGFTLLEVLVSFAVLLVGILGLLQLQILGLTSNQGARAQTTAAQLARELATGLAALPLDDLRVAATGTVGSTTAPIPFGKLLTSAGTVPTTGPKVWSDATPIAGVQLDANLPADPLDPSKPVYQRRWTVWGLASSARVIAVSVVYRERTLPQPREVVFYTQTGDGSGMMTNVAGYR
jgi:type IV pilus assembly protein PilV